VTQNNINILLTLKNACLAKKRIVKVAGYKRNQELLRFLYREQYILSYGKDDKNCYSVLLHNSHNVNSFLGLKIFTLIHKKRYLKFSDLCKISMRHKNLVLSTKQGFATGAWCKRTGQGGTLLFAL